MIYAWNMKTETLKANTLNNKLNKFFDNMGPLVSLSLDFQKSTFNYEENIMINYIALFTGLVSSIEEYPFVNILNNKFYYNQIIQQNYISEVAISRINRKIKETKII